MRVDGYGPTTNRALWAAREVQARVTEGDPRSWFEDGQEYEIVFVEGDPVVCCSLTLDRIVQYGDEERLTSERATS